MPEISRFYGIVIAMHYNEHGVPHFHARYGRRKASIEITSGRILAGGVSQRADSMIHEWLERYRVDLLEIGNVLGKEGR